MSECLNANQAATFALTLVACSRVCVHSSVGTEYLYMHNQVMHGLVSHNTCQVTVLKSNKHSLPDCIYLYEPFFP